MISEEDNEIYTIRSIRVQKGGKNLILLLEQWNSKSSNFAHYIVASGVQKLQVTNFFLKYKNGKLSVILLAMRDG